MDHGAFDRRARIGFQRRHSMPGQLYHGRLGVFGNLIQSPMLGGMRVAPQKCTFLTS